jgi:hypothetical protein
MPSTGPECGVAVDRYHPVLEQNFDASLSRCCGKRLHQAIAGRHGRALVRGGLAGLDQGPIHCRRVHLARYRIADRIAAELIRRLVNEHDATTIVLTDTPKRSARSAKRPKLSLSRRGKSA